MTISAASAAAPRAPAAKTLRVLSANPRYFTAGSGKAVYLTGSHVWWNLADETWPKCYGIASERFNYSKHLDRLRRYGHNFIRLWRIETIRFDECGAEAGVPLQPWARTGPGLAVDGRPRFDLARFDPKYFARLRARVGEARRKGFYLSVMLFEGWYVQFAAGGWGWKASPFNPANNVNGIDGDTDGNGKGTEIHTLANPSVTAIQDAYVRRVVDTVNAFDNVLYEIANETSIVSTEWQYHMLGVVKNYERLKPKRHPVGMTYQHGDADPPNTRLFASKAEWISPNGPAHINDPPAADGRKVALLDTDHLCGVCGSADFVWRSFVRGYNPIYMDPMDSDPVREGARRAMGQARRYALRLHLARTRPCDNLTTTRFCLAWPGHEYVVYQPQGGAFLLDLGPRSRAYRGEWLRPADGRVVAISQRRMRGRAQFVPPFREAAVLYLWHN